MNRFISSVSRPTWLINYTVNFVLHNTWQFKFGGETWHACAVLQLICIAQMAVKCVCDMCILPWGYGLLRSSRLLLWLACPSSRILDVYNLILFAHMEIIIVLDVFNLNMLVLETVRLLKTKEFSVTLAAICSSIFIIFFLHKWVSRLTCLRIYEHTSLRLKVFNLEIRSQNIFC
jgi:hypothetical protein